MKSTLFKLRNIPHPGRVFVPGFGQLFLAEQTDDILVKLYKAGSPYLEPTEAAKNHPLFAPESAPELKPIELPKPKVKTINTAKSKRK